MANVLALPYLNGINFYEVSPVQYAKYLSRFMDDYQYNETIPAWMEPMLYEQKYQKSDNPPIQVEANFEPLQVDIINKYGNVISSVGASLQLPNQYIPGTFAYQFQMAFGSLPEGDYILRMTTGNLNELHLVSNPICLREKHEGTVLLEYTNSRFHLDVVFETKIVFQFRVEGSFDFIKTGGNVTAYEDQKSNPYVLSARPFEVYPLVVGGTFGVPDWVAKKLNYIWSCNKVLVDGREFARSGTAQLEFNEIEGYPLRGITIELREGNNRGSKIFSPTVDPNKRLFVAYQLDTTSFGGIGASPGFNQIQIIDTE